MRVDNRNFNEYIQGCNKQYKKELEQAKGGFEKFKIIIKKMFVNAKHFWMRVKLAMNKGWSYHTSPKSAFEADIDNLAQAKLNPADGKKDAEKSNKDQLQHEAPMKIQSENYNAQEKRHAERRAAKDAFIKGPVSEAVSIAREKQLSALKTQYKKVHEEMDSKRNTWKRELKKKEAKKKFNQKVIDNFQSLLAESKRLTEEMKKYK